MKATEKIKLSRESVAIVASLANLKGAAKIKASRRLNEITALLKGGAPKAQESAPQVEQNEVSQAEFLAEIGVDLAPFERIVNSEITIEVLQDAIDSTKRLLNTSIVPSVFVDAVKIVSQKLESGELYDSLGDSAILIAEQLESLLDGVDLAAGELELMIDSADTQDYALKHLNDLFSTSFWTVKPETAALGQLFTNQSENASFRVVGRPGSAEVQLHQVVERPGSIEVQLYQDAKHIKTKLFGSEGLQDAIDFINTHIINIDNKLSSVKPDAMFIQNSLERMVARKYPEETIQLHDIAAQTADTSELNAGATPTQQQLEMNDYGVARIQIAGLNIAIENPIGSVRRGVDQDGQAWETKMSAHYGYIEDTMGADGDELDIFIAPDIEQDYQGRVFIINQIDRAGRFDEHKVILGVPSKARAIALYQAHYDEQFNSIGSIVEMSLEDFKAKIYGGTMALFDSVGSAMLDSWLNDGIYEMLPHSKLILSKLDAGMKEAKATIKEPIVVFAQGVKYYVVHGKNRLEIAAKHAEKLVPSIIFNQDEGYTLDDIKKAIRKCGNVVHAEALAAIVESLAGQRLEATL